MSSGNTTVSAANSNGNVSPAYRQTPSSSANASTTVNVIDESNKTTIQSRGGTPASNTLTSPTNKTGTHHHSSSGNALTPAIPASTPVASSTSNLSVLPSSSAHHPQANQPQQHISSTSSPQILTYASLRHALLLGRYRFDRRIGSGSFGDIYLGRADNGDEVAVKLESTKMKFPQLAYEYRVYRALHSSSSNTPSVPQNASDALTVSTSTYPSSPSVLQVCLPTAKWFGQLQLTETSSGPQTYNVMVMDRLGPSLEELFTFCNRKFSERTILTIADQTLSRLEFIHHKHLIHRDIKPDNFLIGSGGRSKQIFLIDFGLAKKYRDSKTGQHIPFIEKRDLCGTVRYASINAHLGSEQSRRDDLESWIYIIIYFYKGALPWQGLRANTKEEKYKKVASYKMKTSIETLCQHLPYELYVILQYIRSLAFDAAPDYVYMRKLLHNIFNRKSIPLTFNPNPSKSTSGDWDGEGFDWEHPALIAKNNKERERRERLKREQRDKEKQAERFRQPANAAAATPTGTAQPSASPLNTLTSQPATAATSTAAVHLPIQSVEKRDSRENDSREREVRDKSISHTMPMPLVHQPQALAGSIPPLIPPVVNISSASSSSSLEEQPLAAASGGGGADEKHVRKHITGTLTVEQLKSVARDVSRDASESAVLHNAASSSTGAHLHLLSSDNAVNSSSASGTPLPTSRPVTPSSHLTPSEHLSTHSADSLKHALSGALTQNLSTHTPSLQLSFSHHAHGSASASSSQAPSPLTTPMHSSNATRKTNRSQTPTAPSNLASFINSQGHAAGSGSSNPASRPNGFHAVANAQLAGLTITTQPPTAPASTSATPSSSNALANPGPSPSPSSANASTSSSPLPPLPASQSHSS